MGYSSTKKVASEGGNWFAMVGDIERALNKLNKEQYYIVCLKYEEGFENLLIASELGISEDAVRMRLNRALSNLTNFLGGSRPNREKDYTESTPIDNQNG